MIVSRRKGSAAIGVLCLSAIVSASLDPFSWAEDQLVARLSSTESQAASLLARHCIECHNPAEHKGGLDLTRRDGALVGGDGGPAVVPAKPAESQIIARIEAGEMPPTGRMPVPPEQLEVLRNWIAGGAHWFQDPINPFQFTTDRRAGYDWWSLQPLRDGDPPNVSNPKWPVTDVDRFILAGLEMAGLLPSPAADRRTLIRRLYFDLIGLPPPPEEVEAFVQDSDPQAYERLVERLLDSPQYGEKWARHWLDIVRFAETQGFERNKFRENAWKYRDFVVEAWNADLSYDDFVRWQLAGDVLKPDDPLGGSLTKL